MIDQQLELAVGALARPRPAQVGFAQRRARDRERVDRVGLAARPASAPLRHGQLGRHPYQLLAQSEQLPLQPARQLTAVLDRPQPLTAERASPAEQLLAADEDGRLAERPARLVDGHGHDRLLVYVQSDHDHADRLLHRWRRPASGQTSLEAKATLLSGHARRSRSAAATQRWQVSPRATSGMWVSRRRPSLRQQSDTVTSPRMTLSSGMPPDGKGPTTSG